MNPCVSTRFLSQERFDEVKKKYPRFNEPWTEEELDSLMDMVIQKYTQKRMAEILGRSVKAVKLKLLEKGLYMRKRKITDRDWFLGHMYDEQISIQAMAFYARLPENEVLIRLLRLGVAKRTLPERPLDNEMDWDEEQSLEENNSMKADDVEEVEGVEFDSEETTQ